MGSPGGTGSSGANAGNNPGSGGMSSPGGGGGGAGTAGAAAGAANAGANAAGAAAAAAGAQAAAGAKAAASQSKSTNAVGNMGAAKSAGAAAAAAQGAAAQAAKAGAVGLGGTGAKSGTQGPNAAAGAAAARSAASAAAAGGLAKAAAAANAGAKTTGANLGVGNRSGAAASGPNAAAAAAANKAGLAGAALGMNTVGQQNDAMARANAISRGPGDAARAAASGGFASAAAQAARMGAPAGFNATSAIKDNSQLRTLAETQATKLGILGERMRATAPQSQFGGNPGLMAHTIAGEAASAGIPGMADVAAQMATRGMPGMPSSYGKTSQYSAANTPNADARAAKPGTTALSNAITGGFLGLAPSSSVPAGVRTSTHQRMAGEKSAWSDASIKSGEFAHTTQNWGNPDPGTPRTKVAGIVDRAFGQPAGTTPTGITRSSAPTGVGTSVGSPQTAEQAAKNIGLNLLGGAPTPSTHIQDRPQAMQRYGAETTSMPSLGTAPSSVGPGPQPSMGALSQAKTMGTNPAMGAMSQASTMGTDMAQAAMAQAQTMGTNPAMGAFGQAQTMGTNPAMSALGGVPAGTPAALGGMIGAAMNPGTPNQMNAPSAPATGLAMRSGAAFPGGSTAATPSAPSPASTPANIVNRESAPGVTPTSYHDAVIDAKSFMNSAIAHQMTERSTPSPAAPSSTQPSAPPSTYKTALDDALTFLKGVNVFAPAGPAAKPPGGSFPASAMTAANQPSAPQAPQGYTDPGMAPRNPQETNIARNLPAAAPSSAPSPANIVNKESAPGVTPGAAAPAATEPALAEAKPTPFNPAGDTPLNIATDVTPKVAKATAEDALGPQYSTFKAMVGPHTAAWSKLTDAGVTSVSQSPQGGWSLHMKDGSVVNTDPKGGYTLTKDGQTVTVSKEGKVSTSLGMTGNLSNLANISLADQPSTPSPAAPAAPAAPPGGTMTGIPGFGPKGNFNFGFGSLGGWSAPQMGQPGQQPGMPGMPQMGQPQGPSMAPPGGAMPPGMMGPSHFGPPSRPSLGAPAGPQPRMSPEATPPGMMGGNMGGSGSPPPQQQPPMGLLSPMMSASAAPAPATPPVDPTAPGRIPVSSMGGSAGSLADLFKAVDKGVAASTGSSSGAGYFDPKNPWNYYSGQQFDKSNKPGNIPEGWRLASNADGSAFTLVNQTPEYTAAQKDRAAAIQDMNGGKSTSSNTAFNDANSFLQSLGLSGSGPSTSGGGSNKKSSAAATPSLIKTSAATATTTDPNRIPVSTGTASGSITTKPDGVSGSDWKKYQSLSAKLANSKTISSKNQKWYDAFTAKNGGATGGGGTGGGTGGGGGTSIPGNPQQVAPDVGLLTRPYDNPFERRNLWNLFPPTTSGGVRG